jgi:hypothetical protein
MTICGTGGNLMKKSDLLALFGVAVLAAVPSNAATSTFNFTTGAPAGSGTSNGDLSSYSVTTSGVTATAVAFYATGTNAGPGSGDLVGPTSSGAPQVGEYSGAGMGICETQSGTNCDSPNHQISDGNNGSGTTDDYEFMLIQFSTAVNLSQIQLGNWGTNGTTTDPFGVTYFTSSSSSSLSSIESSLETSTVGGITGDGFTAQSAPTCLTGVAALGGGSSGSGSYNDNCSVNGNGVETLNGTAVTYLLIGASTSGSGSDYFKIQDVIGSRTATPEPATFGLIGFALAGLGLIARKSKQN